MFHAQAGTVMAEEGMRALNEAAAKLGVVMLAPEAVTDIVRVGDGVSVVTASRAAFRRTRRGGGRALERCPAAAKIGVELPLAPAGRRR